MENIKEIKSEVAATVRRLFDQTTHEGVVDANICEWALEHGIKTAAHWASAYYPGVGEEEVINLLKDAGLHRLYTLLHG